jgi:hypothetical protein
VPPPHAQEPALQIRALFGTGSWRVRLARQAGYPRAREGTEPAWLSAVRTDGIVMTGDELAVIGLAVPVMHPESALIFTLELARDPATSC